MNDEALHRTAPATPGLLNIKKSRYIRVILKNRDLYTFTQILELPKCDWACGV